MKTSLDCIPCFLRQALEASRIASMDIASQERILREVLRWSAELDLEQPPPVMGQRIHRKLREIIGRDDPYREVKNRQNLQARALLAELKPEIEGASDPLNLAVRLAAAGNAIDMGAKGDITESDMRASVRKALAEPFVGDWRAFNASLATARRILYLTDNAGEIVFDRFLIEMISPDRVTAAVRGAPVINDATMSDARAVGLHEIVEIIDNGSDAPGTLLEDCSSEFRRRFQEADLILAKGQGNFETLSDEPGNMFFLFKVKCPVVADHLGMPAGTHVLARSRGRIQGGGAS